MTGLSTLIAMVGVGLACTALWVAMRVARRVDRLKHQEYDGERQIQNMHRRMTESLDRLRVQVAALASGTPVPPELIREGVLYREVTAKEAEKDLAQIQPGVASSVVVIDVRTPQEFAVRHVPGAKLVPVEELESRYRTEISASADKVFVYCARGDRSRLACDYLSRQGYMNLYNIRDGLQGWTGPLRGQPTGPLIQIQVKPRQSEKHA